MFSAGAEAQMVRVDDAKSKTSKVDVVVDSVLCMPLGQGLPEVWMDSGDSMLRALRIAKSTKRVGTRRLLDKE